MRIIYSDFDDLPTVFDLPDSYDDLVRRSANCVVNDDELPDDVVDFICDLSNAAYAPEKYPELGQHIVHDTIKCGLAP